MTVALMVFCKQTSACVQQRVYTVLHEVEKPIRVLPLRVHLRTPAG